MSGDRPVHKGTERKERTTDQVYEQIVENPGIAPGMIAVKTGIHRRNVTRCLERLVDAELVYRDPPMGSAVRYYPLPL